VRGSYRLPAHTPSSLPPNLEEAEESEDRFVNRPCFVFNSALLPAWNDRRCEHCRYYLTARCPHIDEFLDDVDDLTPE
jgi:hypothetical protein